MKVNRSVCQSWLGRARSKCRGWSGCGRVSVSSRLKLSDTLGKLGAELSGLRIMTLTRLLLNGNYAARFSSLAVFMFPLSV
jgi:hypothetical protein